jgi:hypothetical protein
MASFTLPPAIPDNAKYRQRGERKIDNASIQRFGRPLAKLLRRTGANGALRPHRRHSSRYQKEKQ